MKKTILIFFLFFLLSYTSNSQGTSSTPVVKPSEIVKDLMSWLYYQRDHLIWSADYVAFDTLMNEISKQELLERLTTGMYLPLQVYSNKGSLCYQLFKIGIIDNDIVTTIKAMAKRELQYLKMEGKPLPEFNFVDLQGNNYNKEVTNGKMMVINCWFVRCSSCIAEMPGLNELKKQFRNVKDILFIGLALDPAEDVRTFLKSTIFKYLIVPDKYDYLSNKLHIINYPTQIIVNRNGIVAKVIESNKLSELQDVLNSELKKNTLPEESK